ncbi:MAG: four helix bundle protein [Candidatus Omnitrophica bacterium]|nr:four helix bundle protein [Candidatus Omnitrophota bacterium]
MSQIVFNFENLEVWKKSVTFAEKVLRIIELIRSKHKHYRLIEQLESSSTSVALNIAEGKGRYSKREFVQFLYIARGSLYETVALLIILDKIDLIDEQQMQDIRYSASEIIKMLSGLINAIKTPSASTFPMS